MDAGLFPDRPLTRDEVANIAQKETIERVRPILGVSVSPTSDSNRIVIGVEKADRSNVTYALDLIIETESKLGVVAYPKVDLPPSIEIPVNTQIIELITKDGGKWEWVYIGENREDVLDEALAQLWKYRDFSLKE
jgi:hypothetical protein